MKRIVIIMSSLLLITSIILASISYINYKKATKLDVFFNEIEEVEKQIIEIKEKTSLKEKNLDSLINNEKEKELQIWQKELEKVKDL